jgi:hypothetical protein
MSRSIKRKNSKEILPPAKDLHQQISEAAAELIYMSETDAHIIAFAGHKADMVSAETLLIQIGKKDCKIEEKDFYEFFAPLIKIQDWFGEAEQKMTEGFIKLKDLLQQNLIQKHVFRIGKKEIDIYVVGLDKNNILRGIQTKAVET